MAKIQTIGRWTIWIVLILFVALIIGARISPKLSRVDKDEVPSRQETEIEAKLRAVSPQLVSQLLEVIAQFNRNCPKDGSKWDEIKVPQSLARDNFHRTMVALCDNAHESITTLKAFAEQRNVGSDPHLFTYWGYVTDLSNLSTERYMRLRIGPFITMSDCERGRLLFSETDVGTSSCKVWERR